MLLASGLQILALGHAENYPLHPDEAFFTTFARDAAVKGAWWLTGSLDKPPLTLYLNALSLRALAVDALPNGVLTLDAAKGAFAVRLTGVYLALLLVALLVRLARDIEPHSAAFVGWLTALSPFCIAFGPTAFTDMGMLVLAVSALLFARRGRASLAGAALALSVAAKPQGALMLPLVLLLAPAMSRRRAFWLTLAAGLALLLLWDALRPGTSVLLLGMFNNAPAESVVNVGERLRLWWGHIGYLLGVAPLTALLLLLAWRVRRRESLALWAWTLGYSALHLVTGVNLYDRYGLLLLPAVVLLVGLSLGRWRARRALMMALVLALLVPAGLSVMRVLPIGGDRGAYAGVDQLAEVLNRLPMATVVYDHWLGWPLDYYLGAWTNKRRVYYPTPEALVRGALALPERGTRYVAVWSGAAYHPWLKALREAGFSVRRVASFERVALYGLTPP